MNKKQLFTKKRRKNEIIMQCRTCREERLLAYWDPELEYYIYLRDEPFSCQNCAR